MKCHLTLVRMDISKNSTTIKAGEGGEKELLETVMLRVKISTSTENSIEQTKQIMYSIHLKKLLAQQRETITQIKRELQNKTSINKYTNEESFPKQTNSSCTLILKQS